MFPKRDWRLPLGIGWRNDSYSSAGVYIQDRSGPQNGEPSEIPPIKNCRDREV